MYALKRNSFCTWHSHGTVCVVQVGAMYPAGICKISKTNMLISPLKNVRHPTASSCCPCWAPVVVKNSILGMYVLCSVINGSLSQWPRGLRRRFAAERLLGSWVPIPPGAWIFFSCECLCCQVEVSATGRSRVQRSSTDCGVCLSAIKWK
jgi:hypothetical protein